MKKKILGFAVPLSLFLACLLVWYCTIYIYPPACEMAEITPLSLETQMVIDKDSAPTVSCHASTLALFRGELYCAWFGGTHEGHADVTIFLSKRVNGEWTTPKDMSDINDRAHYNPVLFAHEDTLYLYYKIGTAPSDWVTYVRSTKDGVNWTEESKLVAEDEKGRGPVKNKPVLLSNGNVLAPASYEYENWFPKAFADISADMTVWTESRPMKGAIGVLLIQPTFIELEEGHVVSYMRSNAKRIFRSDSYDYGVTWTRSAATSLYNNNSGIDAVKTDSGVIALVHNPVGEDWGERSPLSVALSYDGGETFTRQIILESIPGEYSYPSIIAEGDILYISYTYNREYVKFAEIHLH